VIIIDLNISYSSLSTFKKSPLEYFFYKIAKLKPEPVNSCYGDAGNAVHNALEEYINKTGKEEEIFSEKINKLPERGMFGEIINRQKFRDAFMKGKEIIDEWREKGYELKAEEHFTFNEVINGTKLKITGYVDCIATKQLPDGSKKVRILDWKTNSKLPPDDFRGQQQFYTYLYHKKYGEVPFHFHWYMLKTGGEVAHYYDKKTIAKVERELEDFVEYIKERGMNSSKYEAGDFDHPFNNFYTACIRELARREDSTLIDTDIYRNKLLFTNLRDIKLIKTLDKWFSYEADGYQFSDKYKRGEWDGKIHFLRKNKEGYTLPIGFYHMIQDILVKYNSRFGSNYSLLFKDKRNRKVTDIVYTTTYKPNKHDLRYYQVEAVDVAIEKKIGILSLGTSAGKSFIMAEFLKQINKRSLIVVNRLELVEQTAEVFEDYLGVKVGKMYEGDLDIKNQVTVASVQTISAILDRNDKSSEQLITYLFNVNALMFDECQNVTDSGFYAKILKYLVNAEYMIGLSGSAWRNYKPETLSMKALVGDVIYSKSTAELEAEGFICPTETFFIRPPSNDCPPVTGYHDAYDLYITKNIPRNAAISEIANKYKSDKKILILTKLIAHGEILQELIPNSLLINSHTKLKERKAMYEDFKNTRGRVLVGSQQIFSTGINIPDLDMIINVSASKSSILAVQSIGRVKRKHPGKEVGYYIDFFDADIDVFKQGSKKRMDILDQYGNPSKILYNTNIPL